MSAAPQDQSEQSGSRIAALQATAKTKIAVANRWASRLRERSSLVDAVFVIYERDRVAAGSVLGSAIAFRLFLFFVPTVVFFVGLLGALSGHIDSETVTSTASISGALATQVRAALSQSSKAAYLTLATGLFLMLMAGRTLANALVASSSLVWLTGGKVTAKAKVMAISIGLITSLMLMGLVMNRIRSQFGIAAAGMSVSLSAALYVVVFVVLMAALPRRTLDPAAMVPGAIFASLVVHGMQAFSQFYLPGRLSEASQLYGGMGVAVVTLSWLFIFGRALAFSFAINAALFDRFGSLSQALFALPVLRSARRRSAWVRHYFSLDVDGRSVESHEPSASEIDDPLLTSIETLSQVESPDPGRPTRI